MMNDSHIILRQVLDVKFDDQKGAFALQSELSTLCRNRIQGVLAEELDRLVPHDVVIKLDQLALNLGAIPYDNLSTEFEERVRTQLRAQLSDLLEEVAYGSADGIEVVESGRSDIALLAFFLTHGSLPWWGQRRGVSLRTLLQELMTQQSFALNQMLRTIGRRSRVIERLVHQFSDQQLQQLVYVLEPDNAALIIAYAEGLQKTYTTSEHIQPKASGFAKAKWEFIFRYLLLEQQSFFNAQQFVISLIRQTANRFNYAFEDFLAYVAEAANTLGENHGLHYTLPGIIRLIYSDLLSETSTAEPTLNFVDDPFETVAATPLNLFEHFLQHGVLLADLTQFGLSTLGQLFSLLQTEWPEKTKAALLLLGKQSKVRRRLVQQFTTVELEAIVHLVEPQQAGFIIQFVDDVVQEHRQNQLVAADTPTFVNQVWYFVLTYLFEDRGSSFNKKTFLKYTLQRIAKAFNIQLVDLISALKLILESMALEERQGDTLTEIFDWILSGEKAAKSTHESTSDSMLETEAIFFYLERGALPYQMKKTGVSVQQLMLQFLALQREPVLKYLHVWSRQEKARMRLVALLKGKVGSVLIAKWFPHEEHFLKHVIKAFEKVEEEATIKPLIAGKEAYQTAINTFLIEYLIASGSGFRRPDFILHLLRGIAAHYNLSVQKLATAIHRLLAAESAGKTGVYQMMLEVLEPFVLDKTAEEAKIRQEHPYQSTGLALAKAVFEHLLRYGSRPSWSGTFISASLTELLGYLIEKEVLKDRAWFAALTMDSKVRWRLVRDLKNSALRTILVHYVQHVDAQTRQTIFSWMEWVNQVFKAAPLRHWLLATAMQLLIEQRTVSIITLLEMLALKLRASDKSLFKTYQQTLLQTHQKIAPKGWSLKEIEQIVLLAETHSIEESSPSVKEEPQSVEIPRDLEQLEELILPEEASEPQPEAIYIQNAGIILLHPYLTRYFDTVGLLKKGKFKNKRARHRAVHLIQYIATGAEKTPEYELPLNKILCGVPVDEPIQASIRVKPKEKAVAEQLLRAAIQHWEIINSSSIEGYRQSWLIRDAKLIETEEAWELLIEQKAFDMLLDKLPYGISTVRLSWMDKMLLTQWR